MRWQPADYDAVLKRYNEAVECLPQAGFGGLFQRRLIDRLACGLEELAGCRPLLWGEDPETGDIWFHATDAA